MEKYLERNPNVFIDHNWNKILKQVYPETRILFLKEIVKRYPKEINSLNTIAKISCLLETDFISAHIKDLISYFFMFSVVCSYFFINCVSLFA